MSSLFTYQPAASYKPIPSLGMLCTLCTSLDFSLSSLQIDPYPPLYWPTAISTKYYATSHQPSLLTLFASAEQGCPLCTLIRSELFHIRGHESQEERHQGPVELRVYVTDEEAKGRSVNLDVSSGKQMQAVARTKTRDVKVMLDFMQFEPYLTSLLQSKVYSSLPSTGCDINFKLATTWLSRCLKHHHLCTISTPPYPELPSRVLDVKHPTSPSRLALIDTLGIQSPYITLSHVWGKIQIITTTTSTLIERMEGITMESLSNTFRDAVKVAREMNVQYLWIDSLCIVQNDIMDWEKESVRMGSYYSNALFNIAAVSSSDGSGGLFASRNPFETTPCPVTVIPPSSDVVGEQKGIEGFLRASIGWDPALQVAIFQRPPLWQRAWVLQERLLSSRMLMFSNVQMSWKCREEEASESTPEGLQRHADISHGGDMLSLVLMGLKKFKLQTQVGVKKRVDSGWEEAKWDEKAEAYDYGTEEELIQLYDAWYDLITLYTKCALTIPSDIFPAISGIASSIGKATQDRYVAGLWTNDIHRGLLWSAPDSTNSKLDLRQYRAPSWSWASLGATSNFYVRQISQKGMKVSTKSFTVTIAPHAPDRYGTFGRAGVGTLQVTGVLRRAHPMDTDSGLPEEAVFKDIPHRRETLFDLKERRSVGWYFADNIDRRYLSEVWCCPVMTEERPLRQGEIQRDGQTSIVEARGIALLLLEKDMKIFMRVGSLWIRDATWFDGYQMESFSII